jgi:PKHD-type hydroxylase
MPAADVACREEFYANWINGFSLSELTRIVNYGDSLIQEPAKTGPNDDDTPNIRKSLVSWLSHNQDTAWLYDRLSHVARQINGQYFQYDLTGFSEDFQYTVYKGNDKAFYDWHLDKGYATNGAAPRKLSMVIQLSDPSEYEGGDLQLCTGVGIERAETQEMVEMVSGSGISTLDKTQGMIHIFPSWILHRVTPVTRGTRKTLVIWVCGPKFR